MSLIVADNGKEFEMVPEGVHIAICYMVVDLGTQRIVYQGAEKLQKKILVGWELPFERMEDGRPFAVSQRYTASLNSKSALTKDLVSWRGKAFTEQELKGFSLSNIIGKGCQVSILHEESNGKTFTNIKSVMGLPKGAVASTPENRPIFFDMDEYDPETFEALPQWIKNIINKSQERSPIAQEVKQQLTADDFMTDNDIPF